MTNPRYHIEVQVTSTFLLEQSAPEQNRFVFSYNVVIYNLGILPAKLLSRHWIITHGDGDTEEVRGAGVIGAQPVIEPGAAHSYSSGAVIKTCVGTMHGSYQMQADDGVLFEAVIAPFRLAVPGVLQ